MTKTWNLDDLYLGFDTSQFQDDFKKAQTMAASHLQLSRSSFKNTENAPERLERFLRSQAQLESVMRRLYAFCSLTLAVDTKHATAQRYLDQLRKISSELTPAETALKKWLKEIDALGAVIKESSFLQEHAFYLTEKLKQARYLLEDAQEEMLSALRLTGSDAWSDLQDIVTSTLRVEVDLPDHKQSMPLPAARNLAFNKERAVRKAGFEAEMRSYPKIEESSAAALNAIKGEVLTVSKMRGFEDPLEETLLYSHMEKATLEAMLSAIERALPDFQRYLKAKARLLGHAGPLPFYDLLAPVGEANQQFSLEQARAYIIEKFSTFSSGLGEFAAQAFDKGWLDCEPREGKRGGAFCHNLPMIGQSRIMANFSGSFSNMTTLAHELGHAYHGHCLTGESLLNTHYPMPLAETASIFCETIVIQEALREASPQQALSIVESDLSGACQVIVDIYSRFLFERSLFEARQDHVVSVEELKELMKRAQKSAYGDALDEHQLHPYMWICKPHYYSAGLNYYNFPYAFGLLFAKGVYALYRQEGESFLPKYDDLLRCAGKKSITEVARMAGIDVSRESFFESSLDLIRQDIDRFITLSEKAIEQA